MMATHLSLPLDISLIVPEVEPENLTHHYQQSFSSSFCPSFWSVRYCLAPDPP